MDIYYILVYIITYIGLFATFFYLLNLRHYKKGNIPQEAEDKTVSILIPAYNEAESIGKTIESALALDYPKEKLEIIVIDDGSKDDTFKLAKKYKSNKWPKVRIFSKSNGGKGSALNLGISKAENEIIVSMDADTFVQKNALKKMIACFYSDKIMSVTPSMGVYKPESILQRIQQIEYYMGNFLRKSFAIVDSIHVTPGAFSAYRKEFFQKHGGYDVGNITEDLEIALRIQKLGYRIENAPEAVVYTIVPKTFKALMIQRRRWYTGLTKNLYHYKELFGIKKGILGMIVLPLAVISIVFSIVFTFYATIKAISQVHTNLNLLSSINFNIGNLININSFLIKDFFTNIFYTLFANPLFILSIVFILLLIFYLHFARKNMKFKEGLKASVIAFLIFYELLNTFWWVMSIFYLIMNKKVTWRGENGKKN